MSDDLVEVGSLEFSNCAVELVEKVALAARVRVVLTKKKQRDKKVRSSEGTGPRSPEDHLDICGTNFVGMTK